MCLAGLDLDYKTSLTLSLLIEVSSQESERSCICAGLSTISTFLIFDLGIAPVVWYLFLFFILLHIVGKPCNGPPTTPYTDNGQDI